MNIRNILLPVADRPECLLALDAAARLARDLGANLTGCHVVPHPDRATAADKKRATAAETVFRESMANHGLEMAARPRGGTEPSAMWVEMPGTPEHVIPIVGRTADLTVVSRPRSHKSRMARAFLAEAVLNTGRPVLVLPQKRHIRLHDEIGIAWNRSAEAARAVKLALPLLATARQVVLYEAAGDVKHGPNAREMARYLAWHGVKARVAVLKGRGPAEVRLIEHMGQDGIDLLVMGAYSHSRLRETVFGGVSRFMLYEARVSVFVVH